MPSELVRNHGEPSRWGGGHHRLPQNTPLTSSEELPALQTIRLDREDICTIGRLGSLPGIHSLYLQRVR